MRPSRMLASVALIAAVAVPLLGAVPADAAAKDLVTVKGHVRAPDGHGIAGLHVLVRTNPHDNADTADARTRTSATGRYEVRVERGRTFRLRVTDPGDADRDPGDGVWATAGTATTTTARTVRIDQVVQRGAGLRGRVLDAAGRPVKAGLQVFAETRTTGPAGPTVRSAGTTRIRADGTYRFSNLVAGQVVVGFASPTPKGGSRYFTGTAGGTRSVREATAVDLTSGRVRSGVDLRFPLVASISGRVRLDGKRIPADTGGFAELVLTDADGVELDREPALDGFRWQDLQAGTYLMRIDGGGPDGERIVPEWYRDAADRAHATPLVLRRGQDLTGLEVDLASR